MKKPVYKIPNKSFFRLHHVRSRFKADVEEVLLYVATSISNLESNSKEEFDKELNKVLSNFKKNKTRAKKTIDNWRTEISTFFAFIQKKDDGKLSAGRTSVRLAKNQYLDEFFNYFLLTFQYPAGFIRSDYLAPILENKISFKPCPFVLNVLIEGNKMIEKEMYITKEEFTYCALFDLRVTRDGVSPKKVAKLILGNREKKLEYFHKYDELKTAKGNYISKGDVERQAGDILDYMVYANLLNHKGVGRYYYLNSENKNAIEYHLKNKTLFKKYDKYLGKKKINIKELSEIREQWFSYVNAPSDVLAFKPVLDDSNFEKLQVFFEEYYEKRKKGKAVRTKDIGDYGESLVLIHEILRTKEKSNRQHLINKIPTPLGVGFDIQSIEIKGLKRYIEVKTTRSRKAITQNRVHLTHNEWDSARTLGDKYFLYYLKVDEQDKKLFVIQNPVKQHKKGNVKIDNNFYLSFNNKAGKWQELMQIQ